MNDIFYFIDLCDLANYADDNKLSIIASTIEVVLAGLKQDTENAEVVHNKFHASKSI